MKDLSFKKKFIIISVALIAIIPLVIFILSLNRNQNTEENSLKSITVSSSDIKTEVARSKHFYTYNNQDLKNYSTLEADAKNSVIEKTIIEKYAGLNNLTVTQAEINERYRQKTAEKPEAELLNQLKQMYGISKNDYLVVLKQDILREKVQKSIDKPLSEWLNEQKLNINVIVG